MSDKISRYFSNKELQCRCGNCPDVQPDPVTLQQLDKLRMILQRPFKVNSWHRCADYNAKVGGAKSSQHLGINAIDISTVGWTADDKYWVVVFALEHFTGIGIYKDFIHLDKREGRALWHG